MATTEGKPKSSRAQLVRVSAALERLPADFHKVRMTLRVWYVFYCCMLVLITLLLTANFLRAKSLQDTLIYTVKIAEDNRRALNPVGADSWRSGVTSMLTNHRDALLDLQACICTTSKTCVIKGSGLERVLNVLPPVPTPLKEEKDG